MLTVNRATLVGHIGRDPEIRSLPNGGKAATFSLATSEKWTDREGRPAEATEWHRVVVYGAPSEIVGTMLRKGDPVMVEGDRHPQIQRKRYADPIPESGLTTTGIS